MQRHKKGTFLFISGGIKLYPAYCTVLYWTVLMFFFRAWKKIWKHVLNYAVQYTILFVLYCNVLTRFVCCTVVLICTLVYQTLLFVCCIYWPITLLCWSVLSRLVWCTVVPVSRLRRKCTTTRRVDQPSTSSLISSARGKSTVIHLHSLIHVYIHVSIYC